ncbi:uncharacterized protein L3040_004461 [Drepanopeziza brunnea f. sp. 'multigermtubi']|uniref:uncharacterized protein n=1 Tax=Drepanopeziza brunnea f. sp. 'multigermtubi' TaxID=698441 RepID=UPI0023835AC3|nr:hypothetical protein L3040_004461 [Drepanopeziza brunnea f. sp. 'multigermtubi']
MGECKTLINNQPPASLHAYQIKIELDNPSELHPETSSLQTVLHPQSAPRHHRPQKLMSCDSGHSEANSTKQPTEWEIFMEQSIFKAMRNPYNDMKAKKRQQAKMQAVQDEAECDTERRNTEALSTNSERQSNAEDGEL